MTSCSQIIEKIISSNNYEYFVYQLSSFLYKEDITDIKPFSSDVFKNGVEIYNFFNNKIYCGNTSENYINAFDVIKRNGQVVLSGRSC